MKIKEIMQKKVIRANHTDDIFKVACMMKKYQIGFLPIEKEKKIIGVITDRDLVIKFLATSHNKEKTIEHYMNPSIITVEEEAEIKDALAIMRKEKIKRLLVTHQKQIVGMLSFSDILSHYKEEGVLETLQSIFTIEVPSSPLLSEIDSFYL